jgi:hypothetical protein
MIDWLTRVGWLVIQNELVRITPLGEAVLSHLEQSAVDTEAPVEIALDQGDPVAKARVLGKIHELGKSDLVDAYFALDDLLPVLNDTEVQRVLTHPPRNAGDTKRVVELQNAVAALTPQRPFEIRTNDEFHDRYVIPENGPIWQIGTSLGGIGRRFSAMVPLRDEKLAKQIRDRFDAAWETGEPIRPSAHSQPSEPEEH